MKKWPKRIYLRSDFWSNNEKWKTKQKVNSRWWWCFGFKFEEFWLVNFIRWKLIDWFFVGNSGWPKMIVENRINKSHYHCYKRKHRPHTPTQKTFEMTKKKNIRKLVVHKWRYWIFFSLKNLKKNLKIFEKIKWCDDSRLLLLHQVYPKCLVMIMMIFQNPKYILWTKKKGQLFRHNLLHFESL